MDYILRPLASGDAKSIKKYANNKNVAKNLRDAFPYPYTLRAAEDFIRLMTERGDEGQLCRAICVDGQAVGSIGIFQGEDVYRKSAELGYWLGEPFWGQGIVSRAISELCTAAFARLDIVRIFAEPYAYNTASRRCLEKSGFALEGIMKRGVYKDGAYFDYCVYGLLKPEE